MRDYRLLLIAPGSAAHGSVLDRREETESIGKAYCF
tara:strand:- start:2401 stop:2508 length:108 start_codon:yes stop_codon:yes gene_type:complete